MKIGFSLLLFVFFSLNFLYQAEAQDGSVHGKFSPLWNEDEAGERAIVLPSKKANETQFVVINSPEGAEWELNAMSSEETISLTPPALRNSSQVVFPLSKNVQKIVLKAPMSWLNEIRIDVLDKIPWQDNLQIAIAKNDGWEIFLPQWKVTTGFSPSLKVHWESPDPIVLEVGGPEGKIRFEAVPGNETYLYSPLAWGVSPRHLILRGKSLRLISVTPEGTPDDMALPADTATLLQWPGNHWRSPQREWFAWASQTGVVVLVTKSYAVQDLYLKRLAFFVEKAGFRGTLTTDEQTKNLHGWNAHDYAPEDLAHFFNLVHEKQFAINAQEQELLEVLVQHKILLRGTDGELSAGEGALLGISLQSPPALRRFLFTHESFHALYFVNADFRARTLDIWNSLSERAREVFRSFLATALYDPKNEPLMINEFQAYCLQQEANQWKGFFQGRVLAQKEIEDPEKVSLFSEYMAAAEKLDKTVAQLFHVRSGNVFNLQELRSK